jgi:hypothetical protein
MPLASAECCECVLRFDSGVLVLGRNTLLVQRLRRRVGVSELPDYRSARVGVRDTGYGMSHENAAGRRAL